MPSLPRSSPQSSLQFRLGELAASFAASVLDVIRGASLDELGSGLQSAAASSKRTLAAPPRRTGQTSDFAPPLATSRAPSSASGSRGRKRLRRRSADDIANALEAIVGLLQSNTAGLRAEQIRQKLGLQAKELPRPLKEGLDTGRLSKVGEKRATTYFAGGRDRKAPAPSRTARPPVQPRRASRPSSTSARRK